MDSKPKIEEVWMPGNGNSHDTCYRSGWNGVMSIEMENRFHGDHDEDWIIVHQGETIRTINPRQVTEIVWKQTESEAAMSEAIKARYDDRSVKITPRFKAALIELMKAECEMMAKNDPENADCWTWGKCEIHDLARSSGISFTFGGDEDKPEGDGFQVLAITQPKERDE